MVDWIEYKLATRNTINSDFETVKSFVFNVADSLMLILVHQL